MLEQSQGTISSELKSSTVVRLVSVVDNSTVFQAGEFGSALGDTHHTAPHHTTPHQSESLDKTPNTTFAYICDIQKL